MKRAHCTSHQNWRRFTTDMHTPDTDKPISVKTRTLGWVSDCLTHPGERKRLFDSKH